MPSPPRRFRAEIRKQGANFYVEVPAAVSRGFARHAEHGRIRVHGSLEEAEIRGTLVPRGGGHWLFLHSGMRAAAAVGEGDIVELALRATPWNRVPIAADVRRALRRAGALAAFEAKSPSHRHELLRWVEIAESAARRAQRLTRMVTELRGEGEPASKSPAKRQKPLWICPRCGHRFVSRNQRHSCRRYSVARLFARSEPGVRASFDRVRRMVESVGPVHLQAYRDHVAFLVRVRFLGATPRRRWLDLGFWLPQRDESPRFRKVETLTPKDHVHLLRIRDPDELDAEVLAWIRRAYRVGEQR